MAISEPLQALRVVDSTDEWGELSGRILSDLGADVIRVEPPGGSSSRRLAPTVDGIGLFHAYRNAGKRSACLDLAAAGDRARLEDLFAWADVWIDSSRAGAPLADGLEPAEILDRHPHLVITSVTPFGRTGPYAGWEATDSVIEAMSGMMFKAGLPTKAPLIPPSSVSNDVASCTAVFATLSACWQGARSGFGQHIDLSAMSATAQTTDWSLSNASSALMRGLPYSELRNGSGPVYTIYPCQDGYVRMIILSPRQWRTMRTWLGEPDYLQDPRYDTFVGRMEIMELLQQLYTEHFSTMTRDAVSIEAERMGIACTPVLRPEEVLTNGHLADRRTFMTLEVAPGVTGQVAAGFFEFDGTRQSPCRGVQPLGADTDAVAGVTDDARPRPSGSAPAPSLPLQGLRVLDFGIGGVGVEAGRLFAEYGADVIKIETRGYPDFIRTILGGEMNPSFASSSRSKRGFGVNAKDPEGLAVLLRLVEEADVIIENGSRGTMEDLGVGWEAVHHRNPGAVMVRSQLLGSHGRWADWIGYGPSTQPIGGLVHLWNYDDQDFPAGTGAIFPDHLAGRICAIGALAGLLARRSAGVGCRVEVAQVEAVTGVLGDVLLKASLQPGSVEAQGNRRDDGAPWGAYPCAGEQQWCVICVRDDRDWQQLRAAMGDPAWAGAPSLSDVAGRRAAHDEIDRELVAWTSTLDKYALAQLLQGHGVPCGPMLTGSDQLKDPHLLAQGYAVEIEQQDLGPMCLEGPCFRASGMTEPIETGAPRLGEHTRAICRELLGMHDAEIERLVGTGALEVPLPT